MFNALRVIKSPSEIELMRKSAKISAEAFCEAMKMTRPGMTEAQIEAILEYQVRMRGALRIAYPPVIATGINGNTLHYIMNNQVLKDGDLLLVDAGGEYNMYSADITRTWPVNGKFTKAQREVYEAVLRVQKKVIELCEPGQSLDSLHAHAVRLICAELINLGLCKGSVDQVIRNDTYSRYYPHSTGHFLGMDIHEDSGAFMGYNRMPLVPGAIITVEPGIYIRHDDTSVPEEYRGINIRIEDDVLILPKDQGSHEVLTRHVPKDVDEIEELMASSSV
eukprot:GEZU01016666.1.p2 GENE.GEZU01016666.1~~GEZU01016666.1.p2  ORF type:complete len:278 (-),score=79.12 GEZU01016666.1:90-923(-)